MARATSKQTRKRRTWWIIIGSLVIILVAARIALPYVLLRAVNKELTKIKGYRGHVEDIDVALYRGAYTLETVYLDKTSGKVPVHFFAAEAIDLSIEWKALIHGRLVGKIIAQHPVINFVSGPTEETSQTKIDNSWTTVVGKLMPLKLNRFEIHNGEIHYRDFYSNPKVDMYTKNVQIVAQNLSNVNKEKVLLPSTAIATADVYGGKASLNLRINPLAPEPTFEFKAEMLNLDITHLNNFLQAYGNFDVKQGNISIYTEAAAKNGEIAGYAKPIIKNLKVVNWQKDKAKPLKLVWESVIGAAAWIFKNHSKNQLATRAEFEGNIKSPNVNIFYIIGQTLRNAFIQALYPSLENSITMNSLPSDKKAKPTILSKQFQQAKGKPSSK
jgi:hypothetical protein